MKEAGHCLAGAEGISGTDSAMGAGGDAARRVASGGELHPAARGCRQLGVAAVSIVRTRPDSGPAENGGCADLSVCDVRRIAAESGAEAA